MKHIVYLHGMASSGKVFNHIKSKLPKHKATVINYNSSQSIEKSFDFILSHIPKNETVSIVSHSLGGILAHLIASRTDVDLEHVVSISTPFGGSDSASKLKWFYPRFYVLRDLSEGSKIIKEIANNPITKCKSLSIVSTGGSLPFMKEANDGIVTLKSQRAVTTDRHIEIDVNHFESVQDEKSIEEIKKFIFK